MKGATGESWNAESVLITLSDPLAVPQMFIVYMRQERATSALVNSDQRIAEIATKVGFRDPTVFSRAFKNWTGQSPQQYRKSHMT